MVKQGHRSNKQPNKVPRSATFKAKKCEVPANATFSKTSKRKA